VAYVETSQQIPDMEMLAIADDHKNSKTTPSCICKTDYSRDRIKSYKKN